MQALADGTIDIVATDHAPHPVESKEAAWAEASFGMVGLESALSVVQTAMVDTGLLAWTDVARVLSAAPAAIGRLDGYDAPFAVGAPAHLTLVDPAARRTFAVEHLQGRSVNSPYLGVELPGRVVATVHGGVPTVLDGVLRDAGEARCGVDRLLPTLVIVRNRCARVRRPRVRVACPAAASGRASRPRVPRRARRCSRRSPTTCSTSRRLAPTRRPIGSPCAGSASARAPSSRVVPEGLVLSIAGQPDAFIPKVCRHRSRTRDLDDRPRRRRRRSRLRALDLRRHRGRHQPAVIRPRRPSRRAVGDRPRPKGRRMTSHPPTPQFSSSKTAPATRARPTAPAVARSAKPSSRPG